MASSRGTNKSFVRGVLAVALLGALGAPDGARATNFKIVHAFTGGADGGYPASGLTMDASGNFYGAMGLPDVFGTLYELSPHGAVTVLYEFPGNEGAGPNGVILDKKGNLWGTACCGGDKNCGVIFKLGQNKREKLVHTFEGPPGDGCIPYAALIIGKNRDFYGTTVDGGEYRSGAVFSLTAKGAETVLHSFKGGRDGSYPLATLLRDAKDNLYGTTVHDGKHSAGTIFELTPNGTETRLYTFKGSPKDGAYSDGALTESESGDLIGTTNGGGRVGCYGDAGCGTVFTLARNGAESVLYFFQGGRKDGANPGSGVITDSAGNLYGTTEYGGGVGPCNGANGCGTVYELAPDGTETVLHAFDGARDGANPVAALTADRSGNYYGTTSRGGKYGYGTVFEITPQRPRGHDARQR